MPHCHRDPTGAPTMIGPDLVGERAEMRACCPGSPGAAVLEPTLRSEPIPAGARADGLVASLPSYLERVYWWAYLRPASIRIFDHTLVVSAILWGQYRHLSDLVLTRIAPGERVLQLACVYGDLSSRIARQVGPAGGLDIVDVAPIQIANARAKLAGYTRARATVANAATRQADRFDCVLSFFLLHELPDPLKHRVVDAALAAVAPGGRAVFVDYARPARWHPLRPVMAVVFAALEPYAAAMWRRPIAGLASQPQGFRWSRTSHFGGLYQVVIAERSEG
jgi:2-polyprenyl-3-methyl-5-hydroxy-6-metoxy-1,4-benzoquinol methylase